MAPSTFIQSAIKRPGALTAKANAAGISIDAFARAHKTDPGIIGDESRFYLNVLAEASPTKRTRRKTVTAESTAKSRVGEHTGLPY